MKTTSLIKSELLIIAAIVFQQCETMHPDVIGIRQTLRKISGPLFAPGVNVYGPFVSEIVRTK